MIKSRRMRFAGLLARMEEKRNACTSRILVGKSEGKRPLRRLKRRWKDISMDLREIG
jgi:hypothetical protein